MKFDIKSFGEDEIQDKAIKIALLMTFAVWALFLIVLAVIPPFTNHKEEYRTINLIFEDEINTVQKVPSISNNDTPLDNARLNTPKVEEESPKPVVPKETPSSALKKDAAPEEKKESVQVVKETSKPTVKAEAKPAPIKEKIVYKKSNEELLREQTGSSNKKSVTWDDSIFGDSEDNETSSDVQENTQNLLKEISGVEALSGTAASSSTSTSVNSKIERSNDNYMASSSTTSSLGKIVSTTYSSPSAGNIEAKASIGTADVDGKVAIKMEDGTARILLEPSSPIIYISPENARLIDNPRTVTIYFKVLAKGNVPMSDIGFRPSASLPIEIRSEIQKQIALWRFSPYYKDGQANFEFSIKKR